MGPDWSLLPSELLQAISEKVATSLADYADYIRFRAVCHPWRSASSPQHLHLRPQLPWLMLPYQSSGNDDYTRLFYDISNSKTHRLSLPETQGFEICGSSHGWFILLKDHHLSFFNPITHAIITLPDFTGPPHPLGILPFDAPNEELFFENWDSDRYAMEPTYDFRVTKAILTSSPLDPSCLVFVNSGSVWLLSFCKIGDEHWTVIEFDFNLPWEYYIYDLTYSNGCLYTIDHYGNVTVYNLSTPSRVMLDCFVVPSAVYLVHGSSQDILLVGWRIYADGRPENETEYIVYKLNNDEEPEWIEVRDIGQNVLLLGGDRNAILLSSANLQFPGWGANCLCYDSKYTEIYNREQSWVSLYNHNIKLARLDDGKVTSKTGDLGSFQKNGHWQKSLWLTPSLQ